MEQIIEKWQEQYEELKMQLIEHSWDLSEHSDLIEYNILCVKAMVLHECILDATKERISETDKR